MLEFTKLQNFNNTVYSLDKRWTYSSDMKFVHSFSENTIFLPMRKGENDAGASVYPMKRVPQRAVGSNGERGSHPPEHRGCSHISFAERKAHKHYCQILGRTFDTPSFMITILRIHIANWFALCYQLKDNWTI